jgi:hypothetical protein
MKIIPKIVKVSRAKKLLLCLFGLLELSFLAYGCNEIAKPMDKGAIIYSRKCSSCHNLIEPSRFDMKQWQHYVDKYGEKMTIEEKQLLLDYLGSS